MIRTEPDTTDRDATARESIPSSALDTLAQNVLRLADLDPLLDAFGARQLRPIALKGLALLHTIYDDELSARPMADLDLLVPPERLSEAEEVLLDQGYTRVPHHQSTFVGGEHGTRIDLTDSIWYLDRAELQRFIARSTSVERDGRTLSVPALEDHLLFVATHAVVLHGQLRPAWQEDLRRLIAADPTWPDLVDRARRAGLTVPLSCALERAVGQGAVVPTGVRETLAPRGTDRVRASILGGILGRPETHETGHLLRLLFRRESGGTVRALWKHVFPGREFIERRYGVKGRPAVLAHQAWRPASTALRTVRYAARSLTASRKRAAS